jgi:thiosulfate reductase cytochrome b subunit
VNATLQPAQKLAIQRKHPLAIRWMHWINFPLIFTMIWSGTLIYWADSIPTQGHLSQVYRVGIGAHTLFRFFPPLVYTALGAQGQLVTGLGYHFFFMWLFAVNGVIYAAYLALSGAWREMLPGRGALIGALQVVLYDLHLRRNPPPQQGKYNPAQRIAYTLVVLMGAGSLVTGAAIWKPASLHWLTALCGGYEMARWVHFLLTLGFVGFFLMHVSQVALAGWNNFRSMISGDEFVRVPAPVVREPTVEQTPAQPLELPLA